MKRRGLLQQQSSAAFLARPRLPYFLSILPVDVLQLSARSWKALIASGADTVGVVMRSSDQDLLKMGNFGPQSLLDVHRALDQFVTLHASEIQSEPRGASKGNLWGESTGLFTGGWNVPLPLKLVHRCGHKPIQDALSAPVEALKLSKRSLGVLRRAGIYSISQLLAYSKPRLSSKRNLGQKSLNEIGSKIFTYLSRLSGEPTKS